MTNRNAIAAWLSAHAVIAAQVVANHYFHKSVSSYWQQEIAADAVTVVLYVGKDGVKGALLRGLSTLKRIWSGPAPVA